jgi:hypothetical protein
VWWQEADLDEDVFWDGRKAKKEGRDDGEYLKSDFEGGEEEKEMPWQLGKESR